MNKRQRKKRAKKLGVPFDEARRSRRRRPEASRPAEAPGRPPVRPSRSQRAALAEAAESSAGPSRSRARRPGRPPAPSPADTADPTVTAAPSLTAAAVGLVKATGELAGEVVKQTVVAAEEAVEGVVDKVPLVGKPAARELHHLTHDDDEPASGDDEEPLS